MDFTRDPLSIVGAPVYIGILSNLGILFWAAGATICFFRLLLLVTSSIRAKLFIFCYLAAS